MEIVTLISTLEKLTGEPVPFADELQKIPPLSIDQEHGLGYSQLNEILLLAGLDRVSRRFFAYLVTGQPAYNTGLAFQSQEELEDGVDRFRKTALLIYGNVKYAFKSLSQDDELLTYDLESVAPRDRAVFEMRHEPVLPIVSIAPEDAYLTGYIVEGEIRARLEDNPHDQEAQRLEERRVRTIDQSLLNQAAYLASDHLDVYVATSMRAKHEFISIHRTVKEIFQHELLTRLKLRWFDPTQAYCMNRVDKGLAEALMLKRATCTIYLAQESDTLGKDSELASTLAQGKPVVAYVPDVTEEYLAGHFKALTDAEPTRSEVNILLDQLRIFEPGAAWLDSTVRTWCDSPDQAPLHVVKQRVTARIKSHYDSRARTLKDAHPLGIQVNLQTGVANGVLVVRTIEDCARVIEGIVTGMLDFELQEGAESTVLRERISGSIFRVMTADRMLTNTFWNFYLNPAE